MATILGVDIIITAINRVTKVANEVVSSLKSIQKTTEDLAASWRRVERAGSDFIRRVRNMALILIGGATSMFALGNSTANYAEQLTQASTAAGIATDKMEQWWRVAQKANITSDDLNLTFKTLNRSIAEAASNPASDAGQTFARMGISVRDANGHLKDVNAIIMEVSKNIEQTGNASVNAMNMNVLFGRGASAAWASLLKAGPEKLGAAIEQAKEFGTMTKEQIKDALAFQDSMNDVWISISAVKNIIGTALIPVLKPYLELFSQWVKDNRDLIKSKAEEWVKKLTNSVKNLYDAIAPLIKQAGELIDQFGGIENIIKALATVYIVGLIVSFGQLVLAVGQFAAFFVAGGPFTLALIGVAALAAGFYYAYKNSETFKKMVDSVVPILKGIAAGLSDMMDPVLEKTTKWIDMLVKAAGGVGIVKDPGGEDYSHYQDTEKYKTQVEKAATKSRALDLFDKLSGRGAWTGSRAASSFMAAPSLLPHAQAESQAVALPQSPQQKLQLNIGLAVNYEGRPKEITVDSPGAQTFYTANVGRGRMV